MMQDVVVTIAASVLGAAAGWMACSIANDERLKRAYRWGRVDATRDIMRKLEEMRRGD